MIGISDGDTISCLDDNKVVHKVRLAEIDAPEKKQAFGTQSKNKLSDLIYRQQIAVHYHKKDRYGRILGYVKKGGIDINKLQIRNGFAWFYEKYGENELYKKNQEMAQFDKKGLWGHYEIIAPWDFRDGIIQSTPPKTITQLEKPVLSLSKEKSKGTLVKAEYNCTFKFCSAISSCDEAQYLLNICGFKKLDRNNDGVPCENVCQFDAN